MALMYRVSRFGGVLAEPALPATRLTILRARNPSCDLGSYRISLVVALRTAENESSPSPAISWDGSADHPGLVRAGDRQPGFLRPYRLPGMHR